MFRKRNDRIKHENGDGKDTKVTKKSNMSDDAFFRAMGITPTIQ